MSGVRTRDKLIEAATVLFAHQGYDATTIGDIEAEAGLTPRAGGFYRHFESKAAMLEEVLERRLVETPDNLGVRDLFPLGDTRAELLALARAYLRINVANRALARVVAQETARNPALRRRLKKANAALLDALADWLKTKRAARKATPKQRRIAVGIIFGGWLFLLGKHVEETLPADLDIDSYAQHWAAYWAPRLDSPDPAGAAIPT